MYKFIETVEQLIPRVSIRVKEIMIRQMKERERFLRANGGPPEEIEAIRRRHASYVSQYRSLRENVRSGPPPIAECILKALCSKTDREYVIGDLVEEFRARKAKHGKAHAVIWFYLQTVKSSFFFIRKALWRLVWEWLRRRL